MVGNVCHVPHAPEQTRQRLFSAAVEEFSEYGYAGARIDRLCQRAGVNRERLYANFGTKRSLFETVLATRLAEALDQAPVRGSGAAAAAAFAGDYFDACRRAPEVPRLVAWEALELNEPVVLGERRERAVRKISELQQAVPEMAQEQVEDLFLTVVGLCHTWFTHGNLGRIIVGDDMEHDRRRAAITSLAAAMC